MLLSGNNDEFIEGMIWIKGPVVLDYTRHISDIFQVEGWITSWISSGFIETIRINDINW